MLQKLSDSELFDRLRSTASEERRITGEVLSLLREVSRRRLHARLGFESLFAFLVKELGYDEASAYRRISAIRAIEAVPEVEQKLEAGQLTVATVAQAETFFRQEKKRGVPCSPERKREVLGKLEGCSRRQSQKILAQEAPEAPRPDRQRTLSSTQTEIRFTADPELMEMLHQLEALTAHREREPGFGGLFKFLAREALKKLDPERREGRKAPSLLKAPSIDGHDKKALSPVKAPEPVQPKSRYIPAALKREVWRRDQGKCTYISPLSGRRCESRYGLEYEHQKPWASGGETRAENLTLHCRLHNREQAYAAFGDRKMAYHLGHGGTDPARKAEP
jgi:hypothetical protein